MKTIVKEYGTTTINLLELTEIKSDIYCEMKFKSTEEINKEFGVDADYIKINPSDFHNGCVCCDMVLVKENEQGERISDTYIYGTFNDSSFDIFNSEKFLNFEIDDEDLEDVYTNYYIDVEKLIYVIADPVQMHFNVIENKDEMTFEYVNKYMDTFIVHVHYLLNGEEVDINITCDINKWGELLIPELKYFDSSDGSNEFDITTLSQDFINEIENKIEEVILNELKELEDE